MDHPGSVHTDSPAACSAVAGDPDCPPQADRSADRCEDAWTSLRRRLTSWRQSTMPGTESHDTFSLVLWMMGNHPDIGSKAEHPPSECSDDCGLAVDHPGQCRR